MQSQRAVLLNSAMTAQMHLRTSADTIVSALPRPRVYGSVVMDSTMLYGSTLVLHTAFVEDDILDSIERHRATMFEGVPMMYMYLLKAFRLDDADLSSLTRCTVGGQTMPVAKMRRSKPVRLSSHRVVGNEPNWPASVPPIRCTAPTGTAPSASRSPTPRCGSPWLTTRPRRCRQERSANSWPARPS